MFKEEEGTVYDAVRASITRYSADQTQNFYLEDFFYSGDPNLTFIISNADATQETVTDWVVVYGDSTVECSDENTCEFSVAFKRNFEIYDEYQDIEFKAGKEQAYSLVSFF